MTRLLPTDLTSITLPNGLTSIGNAAFVGCRLTSLILPNGTTSIGDSAFAGDILRNDGRREYAQGRNRFQNLVIPDSVTYIWNNAFRECGIQTLRLGNGLKTIENGAFAYNTIEDLSIPASVTDIGRTIPYYTGYTIPTIERGAFESCGIKTLRMGQGVVTIGQDAFKGNKIAEFSLPASIKTIMSGAFAGNQLAALIIPNGCMRLGKDSFSNNPLTSITIPPSLAAYDEQEYGRETTGRGFAGAFRNITSITLPANVDVKNFEGFEQDFINFWTSQDKKAGTYVKNGRIWTVQ